MYININFKREACTTATGFSKEFDEQLLISHPSEIVT